MQSEITEFNKKIQDSSSIFSVGVLVHALSVDWNELLWMSIRFEKIEIKKSTQSHDYQDFSGFYNIAVDSAIKINGGSAVRFFYV